MGCRLSSHFRTKRDTKSKSSKSDILRCTKLRGVSNQIVSAKVSDFFSFLKRIFFNVDFFQDRVNAGTPTAVVSQILLKFVCIF